MTVQRSDGKVLGGYLLGIGENSLVIKSGGKEEAVPRSILTKISIEREKKGGQNVLLGLVLTEYIWSAALFRAKGQPGLYLQSEVYGDPFGWLVGNILPLSIGGAVGYFGIPLLGSGSDSFVFQGTELEKLAQWERLQRFVIGSFSPPRFHLCLHAANVFFGTSDRYESLFREKGFHAGYYYGASGLEAEKAGSINLARRVQATFSVSPRFSIGLAYVDLSEPTQIGYSYSSLKSQSANQSLTSQGLFAVGGIEPLKSVLPARLSLELGLGLGLVRSKFAMQVHTVTYASNYGSSAKGAEAYDIARWDAAGLVFAEFRYFLSARYSLGISADRVFIRTLDVPAFPGFGLAAQSVRPGNSSLGLSLGLHF